MMALGLFITIAASLTATLTVAIKTNNLQKITRIAQALSDDILTRETRNQKFENLNKNLDVPLVYKDGSISATKVTKEISSKVDYPALAKLAPGSSATLTIKPVKTGENNYSTTKLNVSVTVKWGSGIKQDGTLLNQMKVESTTIVADNGLFASSKPLAYSKAQ